MIFPLTQILNFFLNIPQDVLVYLISGFLLHSYIDRMEDAMENLKYKAKEKDTDATIKVGQNRGRLTLHPDFMQELKKADKLLEKAKKTADENEKIQKSWRHYLNVFKRYSLSWEAMSLQQAMEERYKQLHEIGSPDMGSSKIKMFKEPVEESSTWVDVGKEEEMEKNIKQDADVGVVEEEKSNTEVLVDKLLWLLRDDSNVGLVGVHGMGGVGKTKLLLDVKNKFQEQSHSFNIVYIELTKFMNVINIQNNVGSKLGIKWKHEDEKKRSADILRSLTEKKYVIIFDDVWQQLPLSSIGIPNPKAYPNCCKVVFATRISEICKGADETMKLECLSWKESWTLFQETVGKRLDVNPEIKNFSVKIVEECGGLPLALITAARSLTSATAVSEWKEAARNMMEEPWLVPGMASTVFADLERSFDNLSSDTLKVCFVYFVLYPKGTTISRKWFTDYWIGEGILQTNGVGMDEMHRERDQLIVQLENAGLVVGDMELHNMVRAMAVWIGKRTNKWLAHPAAGIIQAPEAKKWKLAERISLINNDITAWPKEPDCPSLVTLLLWKGVFSRSFPEGFFKFMCSLRVLDLSSSYLDELPASIGELHMLQFLDISNSNILSLPQEMGNLGRLIFLNLQKCQRLNFVPYGVFGRLTNLKVVRMDDTYSGWGLDVNGATIEELSNLKQLVEFDITIKDMAALQALVASSRLQASMRSVYLRHLKGTKTIQLPLDLGEHMKMLQWLRISDCSDLEELVFDGSEGEGSIENLYYLDIERLGKAKILWRGRGPRECLRKLGELKITDCAKMDELVGGEDQVVEEDLEGPFAFPNLQLLYLVKLPSMESICRVPLTFPSLRKLWVDNCPYLVKLPLGSNSAKFLSVLWGSKQWWDSLDWGLGGKVLKSNFEPFHKEW